MARKGEKIFLRPYKTRVDRCSTFCMLQYLGIFTLLFVGTGWFAYRNPIYETFKSQISFSSTCQTDLIMPVEVKDGVNATSDQVTRFTRNTLSCKLCLRDMETVGFRGVLDLSLNLKLKSKAKEELDLRDGRIAVTYTEIVGGHCSSAESACRHFERYSDWTHFPAVVNSNPFPPVPEGDSYIILDRNEPKYFGIISNASKETLNLAVQGDSLLTSRLLSRDFSQASSGVYSVLVSMETKMNTQLVEGVTMEREKLNGYFSNITLGIDIGLFLITLIIFVCGTFEHTDVKYKKWMPQSKGLLMLVVLQLFSSHLFRHLFTLFGLDVAGGFLFSSRLLELIIGCYHLYFWIEGLLAEQVVRHSDL